MRRILELPFWRSPMVAAGLVALSCMLCVATYRVFGNTWDEPEHLAAGIELLDRGQYPYDLEHPPFGRLAIALGPYLAGLRASAQPDPNGEREGIELLYRSADFDRTLGLARLGVLPFLAALLGATWLWARRWLGADHALLALAFLATTPTVLGHGALATLDVPGTAMCLVALCCLIRWFETASLRDGVLLGAATGLAVATKFYAIPYLAICGAALAALRLLLGRLPQPGGDPAHRTRHHASGLVALATAALACGLTYGEGFERLDERANNLDEALEYVFGSQGPLHDLAFTLARHLPVPIAFEKFVLGIKAVAWHNDHGHLSYFLGEVSRTGWWYFYPVDLAVKTPLPLLLLGLPGLALLARRGLRERSWILAGVPTCFVVLLAFCCFYSQINIGVRHVLILYPLLALGAAEAVVTAWRGSRAAVSRTALAGVVGWQLLLPWSAFPDYLPYFNVLAGSRPERIVVDSDLDWGQDLRRLERAVNALAVPQLWIAYRGNADLSREPLPPYRELAPRQPVRGWVAISLLARAEARGGYDWLDRFRPVSRVGKSIDLYFIP